MPPVWAISGQKRGVTACFMHQCNLCKKWKKITKIANGLQKTGFWESEKPPKNLKNSKNEKKFSKFKYFSKKILSAIDFLNSMWYDILYSYREKSACGGICSPHHRAKTPRRALSAVSWGCGSFRRQTEGAPASVHL